MKTAIIILDMARGYGDASTYAPGMVERIKQLKDAAHARGAPVFHVHSLRRPTDNLPRPGHMMVGTDALEVLPELALAPEDIQIYKRYLSGFSFNDLDYSMRCMGIDTVLITGASTDNTVLWTAADAFQLRYTVCVVEDCTMVHRAGEPPEVKDYALRIVRTVLQSEVLPLQEAIARYLG
ncbi:MAG TPA: isochorismatase family cysteine hydrolase [Chloroflexota bacterium]|jgi:nicotinamidase-related amidase